MDTGELRNEATDVNLRLDSSLAAISEFARNRFSRVISATQLRRRPPIAPIEHLLGRENRSFPDSRKLVRDRREVLSGDAVLRRFGTGRCTTMSVRSRWAVGLCLACGVWSGGCQSTGGSGDGNSKAPAFGIDHVPRQSEPEIEAADIGRRNVSSASHDEAESEDSETSGRKGNLLTRFLPGREAGSAERKALPVSKRSAESDGDDASDDLDF